MPFKLCLTETVILSFILSLTCVPRRVLSLVRQLQIGTLFKTHTLKITLYSREKKNKNSGGCYFFSVTLKGYE